MKPTKGYSQLRKYRYSQENSIYHLVFSTKSNIKYFNDFHLSRKLIHFLKQDEDRGLTQTLAFVIMPDHIHWLMVLKNGSLGLTVKRIKKLVSKEARMPIWNTDFYDHAIRKEEDIRNIARYIVANPLRAGLVNSIKDYPHWDAIWL